ncbi:hypothetical protein TKK_0000306 [Trichogramma kaykai]
MDHLIKHILAFILHLYGDPNLPRSVVDTICEFLNEFIGKTYIPLLKRDLLKILENETISHRGRIQIESVINEYGEAFKRVSSDYRRLDLLKSWGFNEPEIILLGEALTTSIVGNDADVNNKDPEHNDADDNNKDAEGNDKVAATYEKVFAAWTPLRDILKSFLEIPNVLSNILNYIQELYNETNDLIINNIMQGDFWRRNIIDKYINNIVMPLYMYFDDLATENPLGSCFTKSFRTNYFCRTRKCSTEESSVMVREDVSLLREKDDYEKDSKSHHDIEFGIKEPSIFNKINNYHVVENIFFDVVHDFLEGVCSYNIHAVLNTLIFKKNYFTLSDLNLRIKSFDFMSGGCSNKPPQIALARLKNNDTLKMSASEMFAFTKYLPLLIGDWICEDDQHRELIKYLRKILDILTARCVRRNMSEYLKYLIEEHHTLYKELYGNLKPKYHFLIHYPRLLLEMGPCFAFSTIRFESRHRPVKANVLSTSCKKNLLYTIGVKQNLYMLRNMHNVNKNAFIKSVENEFLIKKSVHVNGNKYKVGIMFLMDPSRHMKLFGKVVEINKIKNVLYFMMETYEEVYFHSHYHSYKVNRFEQDVTVDQNMILNFEIALSSVKNIIPLNDTVIDTLLCV